MKSSVILGVTGLAGGLVALGQLDAVAGSRTGEQAQRSAIKAVTGNGGGAPEAPSNPMAGPDVLVWFISGFVNWSETGYRAYSFGTTSCNQGDTPLSWSANTNQHPVIAQNMFRLKDQNGHPRFEQIGQAWLKHGFCALDLSDCGSCQGTGCISLGIGCSDPYTAARNGSQGPAGPKYEVNATTGFFPYPPANPSYSGSTARRLRVAEADVSPALNPNARYFAECHYVHPQDSPEDNLGLALNNMSYRELAMSNMNVTGFVGDTQRMLSAILAWSTEVPSVIAKRVNISGEGTVRVSSMAYDNGDGTWDYEYAVNNVNFDRSVGAFEVPIPDGVTVTNVGFHDVDYHSGEPYDGTDWPATIANGVIRWETDAYASNSNANAIRWGTMYNFRFTADTAPQTVNTDLDWFKPGASASATTQVAAPTPLPADCPADFDGSGAVDFDDLLQLLATWGPCMGCDQDLDASGDVGFDDLLQLLSAWGDC